MVDDHKIARLKAEKAAREGARTTRRGQSVGERLQSDHNANVSGRFNNPITDAVAAAKKDKMERDKTLGSKLQGGPRIEIAAPAQNGDGSTEKKPRWGAKLGAFLGRGGSAVEPQAETAPTDAPENAAPKRVVTSGLVETTTPKATTPIKDLPGELRERVRFKLMNNTTGSGRVLLVVSFADGTTGEQVAAVKAALEAKRWGHRSEAEGMHKGYDPQSVSNSTALVITDPDKIVNLVQELMSAKIPISTSPTFKLTPAFQEALDRHDLKFKGGEGPARA